jgi:hypothetical protein
MTLIDHENLISNHILNIISLFSSISSLGDDTLYRGLTCLKICEKEPSLSAGTSNISLDAFTFCFDLLSLVQLLDANYDKTRICTHDSLFGTKLLSSQGACIF